MTIGYGRIRTIGYGPFSQNNKHKDLLDLIIQYGKMILPSDRSNYSLTADTECLLLTIEKGELFDAVSKNIEMVDGILGLVNEKDVEEKQESIFN